MFSYVHNIMRDIDKVDGYSLFPSIGESFISSMNAILLERVHGDLGVMSMVHWKCAMQRDKVINTVYGILAFIDQGC